jgi:peptidyl-prolyl cis-trans isomerase D
MLSYLRGKRTSKFVLGFIVLVMAAFALAEIGYQRMNVMSTRAGGDDSLATIGGEPLTVAHMRQRVEQVVRQAQAQNPSASVVDFVAQGGFEALLDQQISTMSLEVFGRNQGLAAGKRLIDGQIANTPAFRVNGKFDEATFRFLLGQQQMSEAQLRRELASTVVSRQLLIPVVSDGHLPTGVAELYTSLLLEQRDGSIGFVPSAMMQTNPPTDAELAAYYRKSIAHYSNPERRKLRYAMIGADQAAGPPPSDADVAGYYKDHAATYAATERRKLAQVILQDQAAAQAFAAKVKAGTSFAKAAGELGFESQDVELGDKTRKEFTNLTSPAVAAAAFDAKEGTLTAPIKSGLGWHVVQIVSVDDVPARPLATVRDEIAAQLAKEQVDERLRDMTEKLQTELEHGASFDEVVRDRHLTALETPPITADARAPDQPGYTLPESLRPLLKSGFEAAENDNPTLEPITEGQTYALLAVGQVLPAAPIPLAKVRDQVASDFARDRALAKAEETAKAIVAKVNSGTTMEKAFADCNLPAVQKAGGRRADLASHGDRVPPVLAFLFTLPSGATRTLPAPKGQGWLVVHVAKVVPGDAKSAPPLIKATQKQLSAALDEEYAAQFSNAVAAAVKVQRHNGAIAQLRAQLAGTAPVEP